jgi:1,4-alpha-glucan branching enzyme
MSIKKQFLKSKPVCKVSFRISEEEANGAKKIQVLGDFNNWNKKATPMKKLKSGDFTQTIELETGKEYQFRYLLDGELWINDSEADGKVANEFNSENDVVSTVK